MRPRRDVQREAAHRTFARQPLHDHLAALHPELLAAVHGDAVEGILNRDVFKAREHELGVLVEDGEELFGHGGVRAE